MFLSADIIWDRAGLLPLTINISEACWGHPLETFACFIHSVHLWALTHRGTDVTPLSFHMGSDQVSDNLVFWSSGHLKLGLVILEKLKRAGYTLENVQPEHPTHSHWSSLQSSAHIFAHWLTTDRRRLSRDLLANFWLSVSVSAEDCYHAHWDHRPAS